ncbi:glyceraldehyde-3-phosphate dehydrogenase 1 [Actinomortierella ambigua]|uniref:Glyceraldehyde-3-phosphate dehydrogenase 1 n=1 Tax=Actinomortierella ambigua TaxID=1343610 RepID=A0A9P6TYQ9_9FUNG|nr:glyceraldehyde-3-phosphate dehydrogenase 1 [Actinomortierella ambigua]KAG0252280.1 glyceraldehyde-3-phosphate dehydrogenase 1 [Actinomortierella ambigua]
MAALSQAPSPTSPSPTGTNARKSALLASYGLPSQPGMVRAVAAAAAASSMNDNSSLPHRKGSISTTRSSHRYSQLYSMAAEQDVEVEDDLARAQKRLRELKAKISSQSKKNFVLERDVRYLDSRIALLIQNRMAIAEAKVAEHLEEADQSEGIFPDDRKLQSYGNLFFLLQTEPRHIATLCRLVSMSEIDTLLQTVMFTLYGNQYESREEHLLLTMFQSVLSAQFETATEFGSLLRANTPVSRMMTTYTRRGPGQSYLKTVLSEKINSLIEHKDLNLEVNPLKVYEQMINQIEEGAGGALPPHLPRSVGPEIAAANPDVQAIIQPRLGMLMEIADSFLTTIMESLDQVPYGIRWICKQIRSLTKRKYPDATDFSICSLIGGFFFLRFINPAIVTPQAYMLIDGIPSKHPRRTLTLIAKMLQNLANKPSYAKETYMMSLNPFVESNKARINKFLNDLCEVGDFYESLEMDQYMALSKKDINLHITLNELFNTHQLLDQHRDMLAPQDKHHLRICLSELGTPPVKVSRKENKTIVLPLFSRWETPIQDLTSSFLQETNITQADIMYMETKAILVQLIRSIPGLADKRPLDLLKIAETAATTKDAILVRKGIKVKEMLSELVAMNVVDDGFAFMTEEVTEELRHLGNLREKVQEEMVSLEAVYKTIGDHNNYLRSQLDSYKAYLQNVRMQSGGGHNGGNNSGVGVVTVGGKEVAKKQKNTVLGPFKFTHHQLEKDGVIAESNVPENRRSNIYFNITSPIPGTFIIALHYKGRDKAILEMDLKLDDLLEKQQDKVQLLDLEYVHFNVDKILALLTKTFIKR